ncbi:MAG TPA: nucleotidyltransferase domain-containing protein [Gammaproteobacteria bacterium]
MPKMGTETTSLTDALFTRTQARVLGLLFTHPDQSFHLNRIVRLAGVGSGAVRRDLDRLVSAGLVIRKRLGNQVHYQADSASIVFEELRGLIIKTAGVADVLRNALAPLAGEIETAFIYGSIAKGEDHARSDIDVMVISDRIDYTDLLKQLDACDEQLGRPINPVLYSPADFLRKRKETKFLQRVLNQARIHLIGKELDDEIPRKPSKDPSTESGTRKRG